MADRIKTNATPPYTVGVLPDGEEVEFPTPDASPSGGTSQATIRKKLRSAAAPGAALVQIYPANLGGGNPQMMWNVPADESATFDILGTGLLDIVDIEFTRDVKAAGNGSTAPTLEGMTVYTDNRIEVGINGNGCDQSDFWGVKLTDSAGHVHVAPSPVQIVSGGG